MSITEVMAKLTDLLNRFFKKGGVSLGTLEASFQIPLSFTVAYKI